MPVHNADVAAVFDEIADLLEIQGENVFRVRAYRNAARTLRDLSVEIAGMLKAGEDITQLPGIGKDLAGKIQEVAEKGTSSQLEALRGRLPQGLSALLKVPGLGPQRVKALHETLRIDSVEDLYQAAQSGKIRTLEGFAEKTEQRILQALEDHVQKKGQRFLLASATERADKLTEYLRKAAGVRQAVAAGSLRRCKDTVGDLDILVTASAKSRVMAHFVKYPEVSQIVSQGTTRSTVMLGSGLQVDLRVVAAESFGAALHYFTGSKAHNIAVRRLGQQRGLKVNEYGVFKGDQVVAGDTEESVFASVGLPFIPPELREDRGEIEAAKQGHLPKLVEVPQLKGDLHCHTTASDGRSTALEMVDAARRMGLKYLAVTDHAGHLLKGKGGGLSRLKKHIEQLRHLGEETKGLVVLVGLEVDILENGSLDAPETALAELDLVIGAVHSHFDLSPSKQTKRLLKAMDHRHFTLLAHPSARLLPDRLPCEFDMSRVVRQAGQRGCYLELNAQPKRLDLLDTHCQLAKQEGVLVSINSDAHAASEFDNLRFGVGQAKRGWLEKQDVLNTRSLRELRPLLASTMD